MQRACPSQTAVWTLSQTCATHAQHPTSSTCNPTQLMINITCFHSEIITCDNILSRRLLAYRMRAGVCLRLPTSAYGEVFPAAIHWFPWVPVAPDGLPSFHPSSSGSFILPEGLSFIYLLIAGWRLIDWRRWLWYVWGVIVLMCANTLCLSCIRRPFTLKALTLERSRLSSLQSTMK
jgi:hypothetical protein